MVKCGLALRRLAVIRSAAVSLEALSPVRRVAEPGWP
jgi:hypothetical protein